MAGERDGLAEAAPGGNEFAVSAHEVRPVDGAELECGRIEIDEPESTKNFRLLLES
jgi:hypothetical protein